MTPARWRGSSPSGDRRSSSTWPPRSTSATRSPTRWATPSPTCSGRFPCWRGRATCRAGGSCSARPAAGCTATPTCSRPRRTRRSARWRPTGRASSPPRATSGSTRACTGSRRSHFATATSTDPARTFTARPASSRSSVAGLPRGRHRLCSATAPRRATGSRYQTLCERICWPPRPTSSARSTSATVTRRPCSTCWRRCARSATSRSPTRSSLPRDWGRSSGAAWTSAAHDDELGWEAQVELGEGLERILRDL